MGKLFHEFAVVIMAAIIISGIVSLSLTPMLCSRFLKPRENQNAFQRSSEKVFDGARDFYGWTLHGVIRHRFLTVLTFAGPWWPPFISMGWFQGLHSQPGHRATERHHRGSQDISFDGMVERQAEAAAVIQADPDIDAFVSSVGQGGGTSSGNQGRISIR